MESSQSGNLLGADGFLSMEFELDLQNVLLSDFDLQPAEHGCLSSGEEFYLKSKLFADEDEGFDEDFCEEDLLSANTSADVPRGIDAAPKGQREDYDDGVDEADELFAVTGSANVAGSSFAASNVLYPEVSRDSCYGSQSCVPLAWDSVTMELLSAGHCDDHVIPTGDMQLPKRQEQFYTSPPVCHLAMSPRTPSPVHKPSPRQQEACYNSSEELLIGEMNINSTSASGDHIESRCTQLPTDNDLVAMPFYKFKRLLDNQLLSSKQKAQAKAMRKKGKNKSAARHCRQRKVAMLDGLEYEVSILQEEQSLLAREKARLMAEASYWECRCASLSTH